MTLGPIAANYRSLFGIAQVNHNDLPVPRDWVVYARRLLEPRLDAIALSLASAGSLIAHLPGYAAIGTRFAIYPANRPLSGLAERYTDSVIRIYEVPGTRQYSQRRPAR